MSFHNTVISQYHGVKIVKLLKGSTAFITGGGQGIGRGIAHQLALAGADIIIGQRNQKMAQQVVSEVQAMGRKASAVYIDVSDTDSVRSCVEKTLELFPKVQIVVNNSGSLQENKGEQTTGQDFDLCYQVNLKGIWNVASAFTPHFAEHRQGKVINICSTGGRGADPLFPAYCASKAAAINLTQSLAVQLAAHNVNVNSICPGLIWTAMWGKVEHLRNDLTPNDMETNDTSFNFYVEKTPLKRSQTPEDIGNAAVFFASEYSKNITGQSIDIAGGELLT